MSRPPVVFAGLLMALLPWFAVGQTKSEQSLPDLFQFKPELRASSTQQTELRTVAMDAPLEASEYYLGPGDLLSLYIWTASPVQEQLSVTPEEVVLIPSVGSASVKGLTLKEARTQIVALTRGKYPRADVTLTLLFPRKVSVQINGQVLNESKFEISSALRVDHLIEMANALPPTQLTKDFYISEAPRLHREASQRFIVLHRRDGTTRRVDLLKYQATGKGEYNPYLREGDQVYVPIRRAEDNNCGVFGAVFGPISFEYVAGDSLTDFVGFAYGLKPTADSEYALLARQSLDGGSMDTTRVDVAAILEGRVPNIAMRPGDRLVIPERPEYRRAEYVTIQGEVVRPGRYPITPYTTKLTDAIRMAGGFTKNANISASTLIRGQPYAGDLAEQIASERLKSMRSYFAMQDSAYYLTETSLRLQGEIVSADFYRIFVDGDSTADVGVRNMDQIHIPMKVKSVYVFGQVVRPGDVGFVEGEGYEYYIDKALGFTDNARRADIKIIKAGTRIWLDPGATKVEDGDYIWIPRESYYPFSYYLTTWAQIAGIVGTVATVLLLVRTWNR